MDVLSKALELPVSQLQKLINRGKSSFKDIAHEVIDIDPMFLEILMNAREKKNGNETKQMIKIFIKNQLKGQLETQYFSVNKELLQDFYFDLSEESKAKYQKYFKSPFSQYTLADSPINEFIKL